MLFLNIKMFGENGWIVSPFMDAQSGQQNTGGLVHGLIIRERLLHVLVNVELLEK
jgi:hypothetical protein